MPEYGVAVEKSFWEKYKIILVLLLVVVIITAIVLPIVLTNNNSSTSVDPPTNNSSTSANPPTNNSSTNMMPMDQMPMGQIQLPPLEDIPISIKKIIIEIGQNKATPEQLKRFEKAILDTIEESKTTALKIVNDVINAPKDKFGQPLLEKKISSLYILMFMLFIGSDGKYFKNEVGPVMEASLGPMSKQ